MLNPPDTVIKRVTLAKTDASPAAPELPLRGGRSSLPDNRYGANLTIQGVKYTRLEPTFAVDWLPVLEYLAVFNQDVSYAVDNVVMLANSGHEIFFADKVKEAAQKEMLTFLKESSKNWYQNSGGVNSLVNDLLTQAVINGCVSAEIIPTARLDDIDQIERVSPYQIRFFRDEQTGKHLPFQRIDWAYGTQNVTQNQGYKALNPLTYKYVALRRVHTGPYATPPFLAALEGIFIQRDMILNFKYIMKKLGALGTLAAYLTMPDPQNNESPEAYMDRCKKYLDDQIPELERFNSTGIVAGFDKVHRFETTAASGNASGADVLFGIVERLVMAGLKQDPNMLGRQQSTTETFGRVLLAKLTTQIANYQETVAAFLQELYYMALLFNGYAPGKVEVIFKPAMVGDKLKDEQAYQLKLANLVTLQDRGIIDQLGFAQEAGYDEPALAEPPAPPAPAPGSTGPNPEGGGSKNPAKETDTTSSSNRRAYAQGDRLFYSGDAFVRSQLIADLLTPYAALPPFPYAVPEGCQAPPLLESFTKFDHFADAVMNEFVRRYSKPVYSRFKKAIAAVTENVKTALGKLPEDAAVSDVLQVVLYETYSRWPSLFTARIEQYVNKLVSDIYRNYRTDKKVLGDMKKKPAPALALHDYRAMEYLKGVDQLYLGRFITDADTRKRLTRWIENRYAVEDHPVGKNAQSIALFSKELGETLQLEGWKIRRIIDTSVNKIRNYSHVAYLQQSKVERFSVVEVMDQLTCQYCQHVDGKTFSVQTAYEKTKKVIDAGTSAVKEYSPFATNYSEEEFKKMDAEALQNAGFDAPPFHCHCRGRIVAE